MENNTEWFARGQKQFISTWENPIKYFGNRQKDTSSEARRIVVRCASVSLDLIY